MSTTPVALSAIAALRITPGFRKTRSGAQFSPWGSSVIIPLHAPASFELEALLAAANDVTKPEHPSPPPPSPPAPPPLPPSSHPTPPLDPLCSAASSPGPNVQQHQPQPDSADPALNLSKDAYHAKRRSKARRKRARELNATEQVTGVRPIKAIVRKRRQAALPLGASLTLEDIDAQLRLDGAHTVHPQQTPVASALSLDPGQVPITKSAFVAKGGATDHGRLTKAEALAQGMEYVAWDGRDARPILDNCRRVFAVLAGSPRDPQWPNVTREAQELLETARDDFLLHDEDRIHRRGMYSAIRAGISYGGGQTYVKNFDMSVNNQAVVDRLLHSSPLRRLANFASRAMQAFAPRLHGHYLKTLTGLLQADSRLRVNFENNAFAAAMFNLGPRVVTSRHRDQQNLSWGWCSITAMGDFDYRHGGHLILWDLRMMIEFPPGSTILIPSAVLEHSNVDIGVEETRYSFTQYSAGGLFRWTECGHMSLGDFEQQGGVLGDGVQRWRDGLRMYSTWDELCSTT